MSLVTNARIRRILTAINPGASAGRARPYDYSTMVFTAGGQIPFPGLAGESWSFQRWNRDPANPAVGCSGGFCVAGFSDAVTLCMTP